MNKTFNKLYPFTTENISGYIDSFDLKNKSLLTVGSSIDQVIDANLLGSNNITILDISPNAKYYYYLKIASILSLSLDEFLNFLCPTNYPKFYRKNINLYNLDTYKKIKSLLKKLDNETFNYWDEIFNTLNSNSILNNLFISDIDDIDTIKKNNRYLSSEILYNYAKETLKKIDTNFIISDISDINISNKYDNIWLSNIVDYMNIDLFINSIEDISNLLTDNGKLLIAYLYNIHSDNTILRDHFNLEELISKLEEKNIDTKTTIFNGVSNNRKDAILVYKKH